MTTTSGVFRPRSREDEDVVTGVSVLGIWKEWRNIVSMATFEAAGAIRRAPPTGFEE
jgi:hypothetical protein